ncbi:MAG: glycosyltransferase family 4 protein [Parabacteroides sp.]|nr:glycosyltransferase family 4 protein [Parabacteroides sp.]
MKIAFDAKRITHNATGLGNYSRFVVNRLLAFHPENQYNLYTPGKGKDFLRNQITPHDAVSFHYPTGLFQKSFSALWRTAGLTRQLVKDNIDIYHGPSNELPCNIRKSGIASVVTIHDLIFLRYPQFYKAIDKAIYTYKFRQACQNADHIIAVSKMTQSDIVSFFNISPDKINVVYQGCDISFKRKITEAEANAIKTKYDIRSPYILNVGSIEERKNLLLLVKAVKDLKKDIHVIAIGKRTPYTEQVEKYIQENNLTSRIKLLSNVPFSELPAFYQMASLFVYPSYFEGFGIPILEALHSDVPVIAATGSCLEEAGGPNSLYTDPNNEHELGSLINAVLSDNNLAESMRKNGREYLKQFEDKKLADDIINIYKQLY